MRIRMKKLLSLVLVATLIFSISPTIFPVTTVHAYVIKSGDYISLGTYNGEPILWRVVGDADGDNLRLISDKVIMLKAFDGRHATGTDAQMANGSGRWSNSNIRSWLNSAATAVGYACGNKPILGAVSTNEYDREAGFLTNFSRAERGYIKKVNNYTTLNISNADYSLSGSTELSYDRDAATAGTNTSDAYNEMSMEYFYLPTAEDIQYIENNVYTFGAEYHKGLPTEEAVENSFSEYDGLRTDNSWYYWLRDPMYGNDDSLVRCVTPIGTVEYANANNGNIGVRPMCTLDTDLIGIVGGNGSKSSPYELYDEPWIAIEGNANDVVSGSEVVVNMYKSNLPSGSTVEVFHNGKLIFTNPESTFNVTAKSGVNCVEAKVTNSSGTLITSSAINFHGLEVEFTDNIHVEDTFDDSSRLPEYHPGTDEWVTYEYMKDGEDGILYMDSTQGKTVSLQPYGTSKNFKSTYSKVMMEVDFKMESFGNDGTSFMPICIYTNGSRTFWSPLSIATNGVFSITSVEIGKTQIGHIDLNVWYNMKVIVNNETDSITVVLTDEREPDTQKILCSNVKASLPIDYVSYINLSFRGTTDSHQSVYLSTLKTGECTVVDNPSMLGNIEIKGDNKTVDVFVANTLNESLIADIAVAVYDSKLNFKQVKFTQTNINAQEGKTYSITLDETIAATDVVKAFLWNRISNLIPVSPPLEAER